jgi:hypothetical protein
VTHRICITHDIEGYVAESLYAIASDIAVQFRLPNRYDKVPPHVTLKYPVDNVPSESVTRLNEMLEIVCRSLTAAPIIFPGELGFFNDVARVIYGKVSKPRTASLMHMALVRAYREWASETPIASTMTAKELFQDFDLDGNLHGTVVAGLSEELFPQVWQRVQYSRFKNSIVWMHKITLMEVVDGRHVPIQVYDLQPPL